jgi:phosphohistidine phosphatase
MQLYFVRHATAASKSTWTDSDDLRPLTRTGKQRFALACVTLVESGALHPDLIVTSPLVRARETAQLLERALPGDVPIIIDKRLGHDFDAEKLAAILAEHAKTPGVAIVGHNPSFAAVLSAVIGGADLNVRKGSVALVEISDAEKPAGCLMWLAPPSLFDNAPNA